MLEERGWTDAFLAGAEFDEFLTGNISEVADDLGGHRARAVTEPATPAVPPSGPEGGAAPPPRPGASGSWSSPALVIALGVFTVVGAFTIRVPVGNRVGPTAFPLLVAAILLGAGIAVLIGVLRGRLGTPEESEDIDPNARTDWMTIVKIVALVVGAAAADRGDRVDAVRRAAVRRHRLGTGREALVARFVVGFILGLVIQIVFGELLGLSLPLGPLFSWLGPLI